MQIELKHLRKEYPQACPLKDVNAVINEKDVISIIGPSGTGKSTLLRCINMLETPTSGQVLVDGEDITDEKADLNAVRLRIGMVFQSYNLYEHLTVIENVMKAQTSLLKKSREEAYRKGMELLKKVGMESRAFQYPSQLSGGQKQRVAIARTLGTDPEVILFDEPTSALDPLMVGEVEKVMLSLAEEGRTMMIVTHSMALARKISNRIFYMDEGGIYEDGTPEQIFEHPLKPRTGRFIFSEYHQLFELPFGPYDLEAAMVKLETFLQKHKVGARASYWTRLIFEDGVCGLFHDKLQKEGEHLSADVFYDEKNDDIYVELLNDFKYFSDRREKDPILESLLNSAGEVVTVPAKELPDGNPLHRFRVRVRK